MNKFFFRSILFLNFLFCSRSFGQKPGGSENRWVTASPDGTLQLVVTAYSGKLYYSVLQEGDSALRLSPLGITRGDQDFSDGLHFEGAMTSKLDDWYVLLTGKRHRNHELASQTVLSFRNQHAGRMELILRAYNDGVAFRYSFPGDSGTISIHKEGTGFSIPPDGSAWLQDYGLPTNYAPAYEGWYGLRKIGEPAPDSAGWSFPALFHSRGHWILATESLLDGHSYASHLAQDCPGGIYSIRGPLAAEALGKGTIHAVSSLPYSTPWRVLIIGKSLGTIVESNLVNHLSLPNVLPDLSWIKPGRSSWSWWGDHNSSKDFSSLKKFIDLSAAMGWEYSLVDANWDLMENGGTIEDLARYAATKHIGLLLWYNSGGTHNHVTERPRDIMSDPVKRKAEFEKLRQWGIRGVKVDFFGSDKQFLLQLYLDILKDAAANHILVDFHGCTLPRGWSRTYPNLMSMEAVRGAEQYGWDPVYAKRAPELNTILMCTRNVVGSMDFTPVTFSDYACCPHTTTNAHELALSVLFESGLLHFADRAEPYLNAGKEVKAFMRSVPVTWDETKYIAGEPGKLMVLARQKGTQWFIACANGEDSVKTISPDLSFLPGGQHRLVILSDGTSDRDIRAEERSWIKGQPLRVTVHARGGFIIWVKK